MGDIRAHENLGRGKCQCDYTNTRPSLPLDFPTMTFLSQLYALARSAAVHVADVHPEVTQLVSRSQLDDALKEVTKLKMALEEDMKARQIAKLKPSKRLASFADTNLSRCVHFVVVVIFDVLFTWVL